MMRHHAQVADNLPPNSMVFPPIPQRRAYYFNAITQRRVCRAGTSQMCRPGFGNEHYLPPSTAQPSAPVNIFPIEKKTAHPTRRSLPRLVSSLARNNRSILPPPCTVREPHMAFRTPKTPTSSDKCGLKPVFYTPYSKHSVNDGTSAVDYRPRRSLVAQPTRPHHVRREIWPVLPDNQCARSRRNSPART